MTTLDQALRAAVTARRLFTERASIGVLQDADGYYLLATPTTTPAVGPGQRTISHVDGVRLVFADHEECV